jgi:hypothetical protein
MALIFLPNLTMASIILQDSPLAFQMVN